MKRFRFPIPSLIDDRATERLSLKIENRVRANELFYTSQAFGEEKVRANFSRTMSLVFVFIRWS